MINSEAGIIYIR